MAAAAAGTARHVGYGEQFLCRDRLAPSFVDHVLHPRLHLTDGHLSALGHFSRRTDDREEGFCLAGRLWRRGHCG